MPIEVFEMFSACTEWCEPSSDDPGVHEPFRRGDCFKSLDASHPTLKMIIERFDEIVVPWTSEALSPYCFVTKEVVPS